MFVRYQKRFVKVLTFYYMFCLTFHGKLKTLQLFVRIKK